MRRLIEKYLINARALIQAIGQAYAGDEIETIMRSAHTLKSSSASLGVTKVAALAKTIEAAARQGDAEQALAEAASLEEAFNAAELALKQLLEMSP